MLEQAILKAVDHAKKSCDFTVPSKERTFPLPMLDKVLWINPNRLVIGNSKLDKILIFDLPAGDILNNGSCHNCKSCVSTCYALPQQIQYPNTMVFRLVNLYLLKHHELRLKTLIKQQIKKSKYKTLRIHSSGDFYSQSEIDMWDSIVSENSDLNFYAYTKVDKMFSFETIESRKNFNLIRSIIEEKYLNYGSMDYIKRIAEKVDGFICPATTGKDIKCNRECSYCVTGDKALFLIHGSNAKKLKKKKVA